jgi:hypothetical protein
MKKTLVCLLVSLTLILTTATAVFAVDDVGPYSLGEDPKIVQPLVDDVGPY